MISDQRISDKRKVSESNDGSGHNNGQPATEFRTRTTEQDRFWDIVENWTFACPTADDASVVAKQGEGPGFGAESYAAVRKAARGRNIIVIAPDTAEGKRKAAKVRDRCVKAGATLVRVWVLPELGSKHKSLGDWCSVNPRRFIMAVSMDRPWIAKAVEVLDERPTITITTQEQDVNDQIIAALADDTNLYRHGFALATILHEGDPPRGVEYLDGPPPQIASIEPATLRERMSSAANWFAPKRGSLTDVVPAHPPDWSVQAVHKRGVWRGIRPIVGVIEAPTIRPDGSILCVPGYDRVTRLFYRPNATFESIPEFPTEQDAKLALLDLLDLLTEFPFKDDTHRAVWLAGLLTVICRASFSGEVPLFAYDGNCPGAGKSKLVDLISIIASGRRMPRTIWPNGNNADEEIRKRITSLALIGERYTLLDNVDSPLGGGPLDAALTGDTWSDRLLCTNKQSGALPLLITWFASGNNIQYRGDFIRRALQARLESLLENPEERGGWKYPDLNGHVLANRARYVRDALVIVRAFRLLNNTGILPPLGSFEVWTHAIADPVMWITGNNVFDVRPAVKAGDTASQLRAAIVQGWADLPGANVGLTVAAALKILHDSSLMEPDPYLTLRSALLELSTKNGDLLSAKSLGRILKVMEGRNIGDVYVRSIPIRTGVNAWKSEKV